MAKTKICFVSLPSYTTLSKSNEGLVGGAEIQQVLIAKELTSNGYDISFIVYDHGQRTLEIIEGIKIFKTYPNTKIRLHLKLYSIWKALNQANADIYYQRGANTLSLIIAFFCFLKKKKIVHSIASNMDVNPIYIKNKKFFFRNIYKIALKKVDCVIVQSKYQQELLKGNFNKNSIIIKSGHILVNKKSPKNTPPIVLWVGTIKPEWKQPELFLKLAKKIPGAKFQMVGGASNDKQFYYKIKEKAEKITNLEFIGFVPYPYVNKYFANASILVNTSSVEGFSNTFLQAWAVFTPVVSLNADPDEIICKYKLGFHSKTFEQMIKDVELLLDDEKLREGFGENGRGYVEAEHDIRKIAERYTRLFEEVNER